MFGLRQCNRHRREQPSMSTGLRGLEDGISRARRAARRRKCVGLGKDLGAYRLGPLLGRGGMGEVYLATHRFLGRRAAIKVIRPEVLIDASDEELFFTLRRFEREAKVAATLRSSHAVQLYDFAVTADGTVYIAMELLTGLNLDVLVERFGPVPAERAVHFLRQILAALAEMHARGLAHRDIKPANIHVSRSGECHDFVKLTDLGLVKPKSGTTAEHVALRAQGRIVGTPAFIAPEIALGEPGSERSDIYALGCVAYWLVAGCTVFRTDSAPRMLWHHIHDEPMPPARRTELRVPVALEEWILSCLEKAPERRPANIAALARALDRCALPRVWSVRNAEEWWQRHAPTQALEVAG